MTAKFFDGTTRAGSGRSATARAEAQARGWDEQATRAWIDRVLYHPSDPADYGSTVGMPFEDERGNVIGYACVGCWWCEGDRTAAHASIALSDHQHTPDEPGRQVSG